MMLHYGKKTFLNLCTLFFLFMLFFRLECFYLLTDNGKRMDFVDDRIRGMDNF